MRGREGAFGVLLIKMLPSSAASEQEELDLISQLPDSILHSILLLLPFKDSARTSILSSRWRHLWEEAPLRLDDYYLCHNEHLVSWIFYSHRGPIESLHLYYFTRDTVDRFVESAVQRGIRELKLVGFVRRPYQLPSSILTCKSLHQLSVVACQFPQAVLPSIFPNLKELRLSYVMLRNDLLQILLSSCGSLDTLQLKDCWNSSVSSVSSPRLRKFTWKSSTVDELIIEDMPNLESLMLDEYTTRDCKVKVLNAPKLQLLGFLCADFQTLQLGGTLLHQQPASIFQVNAMPCRMAMLSSVKVLAINMEQSFNKTLLDLLRCFPCLEKLFILKYGGSCYKTHVDKEIWNEHSSLSFLDHLKTVTVKGYYNSQSDLELLRYLVGHGKVLRKIILLYSKTFNDEKFVEAKKRQFSVEKRASSDLELCFFIDTKNNVHFSLWNELIWER
ncbi:F-box/RNI-like/FBD-like domains-containing protein [Rhynchospora pubera]|uniref:F-box/RNI-like/FBD-like domains-containing protein n=1 Tax=Rhynchospora pubera TaxID=906938 RepID=A0AAV8HXI8_9POAL|nr:F-box/RNI-like/FBD-like domains-containing protein [Rhynchospora pubera]